MADTQTTTLLTLSGMHCQSCANGISKALGRLEGVAEVNVSFAAEQATVTYDASVAAEHVFVVSGGEEPAAVGAGGVGAAGVDVFGGGGGAGLAGAFPGGFPAGDG